MTEIIDETDEYVILKVHKLGLKVPNDEFLKTKRSAYYKNAGASGPPGDYIYCMEHKIAYCENCMPRFHRNEDVSNLP